MLLGNKAENSFSNTANYKPQPAKQHVHCGFVCKVPVNTVQLYLYAMQIIHICKAFVEITNKSFMAFPEQNLEAWV